MKKYTLLPVLFLGVLFLAGCWNQQRSSVVPTDIPLPPYQKPASSEFWPTPATSTPPEEKPSLELTAEDLNQNPGYFKIRKELQVNNFTYDTYVMGYDRPDCYGFENSLIYGEDLLHMLRENDKARAVMEPHALTKDYTRRISTKIKKYNDDILNPPAQVFYICHLDKDLDVIGAKYFFDGKEADSKLDTITDNDKEHILFLHSKDELYPIKDIQLLDTTGTGGEVYPCQAKLQDKNILWTCFTGLSIDEEKNSTFGTYRDWTLSLDGRILKRVDRKE